MYRLKHNFCQKKFGKFLSGNIITFRFCVPFKKLRASANGALESWENARVTISYILTKCTDNLQNVIQYDVNDLANFHCKTQNSLRYNVLICLKGGGNLAESGFFGDGD